MGNKYEGKVAIITGSSRGIGKAIAKSLAMEGATIVLNGRNQERLDETRKELKNIHDRIDSICCDVSIVEEGERLINETIKKHGKLDILVNNVGVSMRGNLSDIKPEVYQTVFSSNVFGTINPTIPAIPHIRQTKGSIIFISSLAGIRGLPTMSAYCSSKMALRAIAESIRIEEHEYKLHVGLIYVGITEIEHNKETISADGSMKILKARTDKKVHSTDRVAKAVLKNIKKRKFITTLTRIGKINKFLQPRMPMLVEKIILKSLHKFEKHSE
jgi:short-subunit dehydrogenase